MWRLFVPPPTASHSMPRLRGPDRASIGKQTEGEGFEPPSPFWGLPVFKTGAFSHSATPPDSVVGLRALLLLAAAGRESGGRGGGAPNAIDILAFAPACWSTDRGYADA